MRAKQRIQLGKEYKRGIYLTEVTVGVEKVIVKVVEQ